MEKTCKNSRRRGGFMKITKKIISKIADEVEKRKDFKETLNDIEGGGINRDTEFEHTYNAYALFDTVIVLCEYWTKYEVQRQFFIFSNDKLRKVTDFEDEMLRAGDDEITLREYEKEEYHIIHRDDMNEIIRGDK